jgi:ABC-type branched-subunit amino acid transport system ATPase component
MKNDPILIIEDLKKSFVQRIINRRGQTEGKKHFLIEGLDLEIPRGYITALIGANGAGKTTLFNIISGFMKADSGSIRFCTDKSEQQLLQMPPYRITRKGIGRMFQDNHLFLELSVLDNMLVASADKFAEKPFVSLLKSKLHKRHESVRKKQAIQIFRDLFGEESPFEVNIHKPAGTLSYGQQRLLGLARLFMGNYQLILLDEPTAGVSPSIIQEAIAIIRRLVKEKGVTIFLIEHNMQVVQELADFCSFVCDGEITAFGTPVDVIGNDEVRRKYLGA